MTSVVTSHLRAPRSETRTKVLLVMGAARSGTTLVDLLLDRSPQFVSLGEVRYLWQRGLREGRLCGCGAPVRECGFWTDALEGAGPGDLTDADAMIDRLAVLEQVGSVLDVLRGRDGTVDPRAVGLATRLAPLYRRVRDRSGAAVVVDSSKPPTYGWVLRSSPTLDVYVLHVVRDPRACAFSNGRVKRALDGSADGLMRRRPLWKAASTWDLWNFAAERFGATRPERYLQMRYEDLVAAPELWLRRINRFVGLEDAEVPAVPLDAPISLGVTHTAAGNPVRLARELALRLDDEWRDGMSSKAQRLVSLMTLPVRRRYGYY